MIRLKTLDLCVSALLVLFGIYVIITGFGYGYLDYGTPGPGFFPILIGATLAVFSGINLANQLRQAEVKVVIPRAEILRAGATTLALILFTVLSEHIGMLASVWLLMLSVSLIFGARTKAHLIRYALVATGLTAALWLIFGKLLGTPLL